MYDNKNVSLLKKRLKLYSKIAIITINCNKIYCVTINYIILF